MAQNLFILIIVFILFEFVLSLVLDLLNLSNWKSEIPKQASGIYDPEKYRKAQLYNKSNTRFGIVSSTFSLLLILLVLFFDGFAILDNILREQVSEQPVILALLFFGSISLAQFILTLPFSIYHTFVIEEKYGFNRTTTSTFIIDKVKSLLLAAVLGGGLLAALVYIYAWTGSLFWIVGWVLLGSVSIFLAMFYTSIFLPIFNKLTPLEENELFNSIRNYAQNVKFPLKEVSVMDSSKRSSKANAFFSGLGHKKSIVLFDTLIHDHTNEEITAVLAHEVGHFKRKHVQKSMAISIVQIGIMFYLFGWLAANPLLAEVLGAEKNSFHLSLITFSLLYSPVSMIIGIFMNMYSRKNEFEADAYAKSTYDAGYLVSALKKLSSNSLSNLTPHPAYVFFHYSHPPLLRRIEALQ